MLRTTSEESQNKSALGLTIETDGVAIVRDCLSEKQIRDLIDALPETHANIRNALSIPVIEGLARSQAIRRLIAPILGEECFAVRAVLFNKNSTSNWKVAWHQDCVIAVKVRADMQGWGPWSLKLGVPHVRPPATILEKMIAVRVHLDDCGVDNGPLRVLPGTHARGILSDAALSALSKECEIVCSVNRGDVVLMRPLTVHASSISRKSASRRVVHLEFAAEELPQQLNWHDQIIVEN